MPFMLPTILKNLFSSPATRLYPYYVREQFPRARGHITFDEDKCIFCGNCSRKCPAVAIEVKVKKEMTFHSGRCIVCELCVEACPKHAISLNSKWRAPFYKAEVEVYRSKAEAKAKAEPAQETKAEPAEEIKAEAADEEKKE